MKSLGKINYHPLLLLLVASVVIFKPVLTGLNFFPTHDDTWLVRLQQFDKAVGHGQFPPCLAPDIGFGYGYPLFCFYAPLFTFINWLLYLPLGNYALAVLLSLVLITFFGAWGVYRLSSWLWDNRAAGFLAAVVFTFLPYHALDIYVRGSFAEYLSLSILPWLFYSLFRFSREKGTKLWLPLAGFTALFILAHNLFALMLLYFVPLILIYLAGRPLVRQKFPSLLAAVLLTGLLTAFFWGPVVLRLSQVVALDQAQKTSFTDHFVFPSQLWYSPWGFGGSAPGLNDGMSFALGKINTILFLGGISAVFLTKERRGEKHLLLVLGLLSLLLCLPLSRFLWQNLPFLPIIQFPWRFLGWATLFGSFLSGGLIVILTRLLSQSISLEKDVLSFALSTAVAVVIIFFQLKYFYPQRIVSRPQKTFLNSVAIEKKAFVNIPEYLPRWVKQPPEERPGSVFAGDYDSAGVEVILDSPYKIKFTLSPQSDVQSLVVNRFYLPGWQLVGPDQAKYPLSAHPKDGKILANVEKSGEYILRFGRLGKEKTFFGLTGLGLVIGLLAVIY